MVNPQPHDAMSHWANSMEKQMQSQREQLQKRTPEQIAGDSGAHYDAGSGVLSLRLMQNPLQISVPDYTVSRSDGEDVPTIMQSLITTYLVTANGMPRAGEWIAFRELPGGMFYHQAFTGYSGTQLSRTLGQNLIAFNRGSEALGGSKLTGFGDSAYEFQLLPRIWMAVVYWLGDEEDGFPPQANVLFDRAASNYMIVDGLAIVGSHLTRAIIREANITKS